MKQNKIIALTLFTWLAVLVICCGSCTKEYPTPYNDPYKHTLEEVFSILDTCGIPELEAITIEDVENFRVNTLALNGLRDTIPEGSLLDSLLVHNESIDVYHIISRQDNNEPKEPYITNTNVFVYFLTTYGTSGIYGQCDFNNDNTINTIDLMDALKGWQQQCPVVPALHDYMIQQSHDITHTQLEYIGDDPLISFGMMQRTPTDEGEEWYDLNSFVLNEVGNGNIRYTYVRVGQ